MERDWSDRVHCQSTLCPGGCLPMVFTLLFIHGPKPTRTRSYWARWPYLVVRLFIPMQPVISARSLSDATHTWGFSLESTPFRTRTVLIPCGLALDVLYRSHRSRVARRTTLLVMPWFFTGLCEGTAIFLRLVSLTRPYL